MAITWEDVKGALKRGIGKRAGEPRIVVTRSAGPSSYTTGGFDVTVGELGEIVSGIVTADGGYLAEIDWANSSKNTIRIKVYSGAATEVTGGTDLSGVYFNIVVFGW